MLRSRGDTVRSGGETIRRRAAPLRQSELDGVYGALRLSETVHTHFCDALVLYFRA